MDVLVRGLTDEVHAELVQRAADRGLSLGAYLRETLTQHVGVPSMAEWLRRIDELEPVADLGLTGADLVAAGRAEDDDLVGR